MASTQEARLVASTSRQRAALEAVLHSRIFARNPRLSALLEYLCVRSFRGEAETIKEYNIATDVFGRSADFDHSQDAIVRVEVHRLRKKLAEFYAGEGASEPVEIVIHSGRYLPEFVERHEPEIQAAEPQVADPGSEAPSRSNSPARAFGASRFFVVLIAALGLGALVAVMAFLWPRHPSTGAAPKAVPSDKAVVRFFDAPAVGDPASGIRILCGSTRAGIRDREGNIWGADAFFNGGTAASLPDRLVYRTRDSFLYRNARTGEFSYKIPLRPGVYEMRLYFADLFYSPGAALEGGENMRVFNVIMNGNILLREFDIIADAGVNTADTRVFKDVRPAGDGFLHLSFQRSLGSPLLNAIEIVPGAPHRLRPIRIVTQSGSITDSSGTVWQPDNFVLNGRTIARFATVNGPEDPHIYEYERYGNFSYAIPVAQGRYRLTLHFAESYWGANPTGGGPGSRIFNVNCNGISLLRNFDMLKEASPDTQIVKTFDNLEPNAQGKLLISFVAVRNYANLSAIEVVDESSSRPQSAAR